MLVEKYAPTDTYDWEPRRYTPEQQPDGRSYRNPDGCEAPVGKPMGGWISVPGSNLDWPTWCTNEEFRLDGLRWRHTYELDTANIKLIETFDQMLEFHREWGTRMETLSGSANYTRWNIRWADLSREYSGIVIAHYFWSCRLGNDEITNQISNWYYGWDCASGCIWNPDVLEHKDTELYRPVRRKINLEAEDVDC